MAQVLLTAYEKGEKTTMQHVIIASAFGDAASKALGYVHAMSPALIAGIIVSAACALVFNREHKADIL